MKNITLVFLISILSACSNNTEINEDNTTLNKKTQALEKLKLRLENYKFNPENYSNFSQNEPIDNFGPGNGLEFGYGDDSEDPGNGSNDPIVYPNDYIEGYIKGVRDVQKDKKNVTGPGWGIQWDIKHYYIDFSREGFIDFDNASTTPSDSTVTFYKYSYYFDQATFNINFYSSNFFINKRQYLLSKIESECNSNTNDCFWQGVYDGNIHGAFDLEIYQ